jgi:hypothetical protein
MSWISDDEVSGGDVASYSLGNSQLRSFSRDDRSTYSLLPRGMLEPMALQSHNEYLPRLVNGEKTASSSSTEQRSDSGKNHQDAQAIRTWARSMIEEEFLRAVDTLVGENIECWQV